MKKEDKDFQKKKSIDSFFANLPSGKQLTYSNQANKKDQDYQRGFQRQKQR